MKNLVQIALNLLQEKNYTQLIIQAQENPRVKINWSMLFETLNKSKMSENKKGKKEIRSSQNWKNLDMETSCIVSIFLS